MIKRTIIILFLIAGAIAAFPQYVDLDDRCSEAYNHILSLQLDKAAALLDEEEKINPGNAYVPYLRNYTDFVSLFVSQDETLYKKLNNKKQDYFSKVDELDDTCRYKNWMLGNMHLQWSMNKLIFGDLFSAAIEFSRAYYLIEENREEFPEFNPNRLSEAVLHVIVGLVPDKYEWFMKLLSLNGNVEEGKSELSAFMELARQQEELKPFYPEALFYSGFIELNIHPGKDKLDILLKNTEQTDKSVLLIKFLELNILMRTGKTGEALALFPKMDSVKQSAYPFAYLNYLHGECWLRSLQADRAAEEYDLFLKNFHGENYVKDTWRKKAWAAFLTGDTALYFDCMKQVMSGGASRLEVDKEALREAQAGKLPDTTLLKARLLFDGGYYGKAKEVLDKISLISLSPEQTVEYNYRLGRIYDQLGEKEKAEENYLLTVKKGSRMNAYFAANAALKLGEIYEKKGDYKLARENYKLCLEMDFDQYRTSIRTRAKEGLRRIPKE